MTDLPIVESQSGLRETADYLEGFAGIHPERIVRIREAAAIIEQLVEALEHLQNSCTRTKPNLHDDCGTRVVTEPTVEALKLACTALEAARRQA
jgi:hypothetical protein